MTLDQSIALFAAIVSFVGLVFVGLQLREATKQQRSQSLVKIYDINRELISLGFDHPLLFMILQDGHGVDPVWERRYLQLWLNQFSLIHSYLRNSMFEPELKDSLERDIEDFFKMKNARKHWHEHGAFYPPSFQFFANEVIKKEPPKRTAPRV